MGDVAVATTDLTDDDLREWAQGIWAAVEHDPSKAVRRMRDFIEDYERNRHD